MIEIKLPDGRKLDVLTEEKRKNLTKWLIDVFAPFLVKLIEDFSVNDKEVQELLIKIEKVRDNWR